MPGTELFARTSVALFGEEALRNFPPSLDSRIVAHRFVSRKIGRVPSQKVALGGTGGGACVGVCGWMSTDCPRPKNMIEVGTYAFIYF